MADSLPDSGRWSTGHAAFNEKMMRKEARNHGRGMLRDQGRLTPKRAIRYTRGAQALSQVQPAAGTHRVNAEVEEENSYNTQEEEGERSQANGKNTCAYRRRTLWSVRHWTGLRLA